MMRKTWLAPLMIGVMLGVGWTLYDRLPAEVPSHWNIRGEVDRTTDPLPAVLLPPLIALGVWALLVVAPRIDPRRASYAAFGDTLRLFINAVVLFFAALYIAMLLQAIGHGIDTPRVILIGIGLLLMVLGNELGRVRPNWFVGIRTPWTLSDPRVWRRTHRVGGRAFVVIGLATLLAAIVLPPAIASVVSFAVVVGGSCALTAYSYLVWRRSAA